MTYTTAQARQQLLDELASAIEQIALCLARLGEAYEAVDENMAQRLESELFRPAQMALARAKRTHSGFAERHGLPAGEFQATPALAPSGRAKSFLDGAVSAAATAEQTLASLQDSMLPIEVGDEELRAGLGEVRRLLGELPADARQLTRTLGR